VARPAPEAGGRLLPTFEINGRPADELASCFEGLRPVGTRDDFEANLVIIRYVLGFNYEVSCERVYILLCGFGEQDLATANTTLEALVRIIATEPAIAMRKLLSRLPRVRPDRTATDAESN
jgi:hypothetical protein